MQKDSEINILEPFLLITKINTSFISKNKYMYLVLRYTKIKRKS